MPFIIINNTVLLTFTRLVGVSLGVLGCWVLLINYACGVSSAASAATATLSAASDSTTTRCATFTATATPLLLLGDLVPFPLPISA